MHSENSPFVVMKFGGTSVATVDRWRQIETLIRARQAEGRTVVVVHSAVAGVSDRLAQWLARPEAEGGAALMDWIRSRHRTLATEMGVDEQVLLPVEAELGRLIQGVQLIGEAGVRVQARVMAFGERLAGVLGAQFLTQAGLQIQAVAPEALLRSMPAPSERTAYLSAACASEPEPELQARLSGPAAVLTQGFIASNAHGETVLLGRGGSDASAAYLAAKLSARWLEIWTDVPGIFTANPRAVSGARLLQSLHYREAQEIASTGGCVLHPRCIPPVRQHKIPLYVRCTHRPELPGTLVSDQTGDDSPRVKALSSRHGVVMISIETLGMWQTSGFLADVFSAFGRLGVSVDLVSTAATDVTVTLDQTDGLDDAILERLQAELSKLGRVEVRRDTAVISLVGQKIRASLPRIGRALEAFEEHAIYLVSQAASDLNLSFVVHPDQAPRLIRRLHEALIRAERDDPVFGPTWESFEAPESAKDATTHKPWWHSERPRLLELAQAHGSAYVYHLPTVQQAIDRLKSVRAIDRLFFAMKANNHPELLKVVHDAGLGFECVSPGEIERVVQLFPKIDRERLVYTPNFAPRADYAFGLQAGVRVTLDNLFPLQSWPELFRGTQVVLRLDPGQGRGHHDHVRTAGAHSKFGIPSSEWEEAARLCEQVEAEVVGLHAHTGSGILEPDNWRGVAHALLEAAERFSSVRFLDVGGGLGVPEKTGGPSLSISQLSAAMEQVRAACPGNYELWMEPGRYLVAEAGVLVSRVTQLKGKGEVQYVGVETGMNSLIRPALYGAYHEIQNLSRLHEAGDRTFTVVGPNCETGDRLGVDRLLPRCEEGDVLLIGNAGAYGRVMSSNYNLRSPAQEFVIGGATAAHGDALAPQAEGGLQSRLA